MSKLQVLVTTMQQQDLQKYYEMNLHTDALFANQANRTEFVNEIINGKSVEMITTSTRGVGKNRNIALMYSTGDILLIADDDVTYVDGYEKIILKAFEELEDADGIIFNIKTIGRDPDRRKNERITRLNFLNAFNYGAVRIAIKKNSIIREGITFNENFGGGTIYSAGEDSLFIRDLLKHKLRLYAYPETIAVVKQFESTWFKGYNKKYFYDKGALFYALDPRLYSILLKQDLARHMNLYKDSGLTVKEIETLERNGARSYQNLVPYNESKS